MTVASIWLIGQCGIFLRNREKLAQPPVGLVLDDDAVDWLAQLIGSWVVDGLGRPA